HGVSRRDRRGDGARDAAASALRLGVDLVGNELRPRAGDVRIRRLVAAQREVLRYAVVPVLHLRRHRGAGGNRRLAGDATGRPYVAAWRVAHRSTSLAHEHGTAHRGVLVLPRTGESDSEADPHLPAAHGPTADRARRDALLALARESATSAAGAGHRPGARGDVTVRPSKVPLPAGRCIFATRHRP